MGQVRRMYGAEQWLTTARLCRACGGPAEGEASQGPTSAALANALFDATGARPRELPLIPERLAAALQTR
ncbi:conserved domain protein [Myxococcus xanthus DK 1622]|uniref:Conserved domain protein n=1 Tax=Myxococcus xanthus (strain DK1622) TaxID=246197 RepID=Q1CZI4_MYXXD|nr:conserved domain protein [Myxococcus xanthus DK 1622]